MMRKFRSLRFFSLLVCLTLVAGYLPSIPVQAQGPSQNSLPVPNLLLLYDKTTVAVINTAPTPISLVRLTFWRSGGTVKFTEAGTPPARFPRQSFHLRPCA